MPHFRPSEGDLKSLSARTYVSRGERI
jgi:hypothetical protein